MTKFYSYEKIIHYYQISAQDCSTDSVATVKTHQTLDERLSPYLFHLYVMLVEPDYDYILSYKYPNSVIAVRGYQHYIVDVRTGEERPFKDEVSAPKKKDKPSLAKAKKCPNKPKDDCFSEE